MPRGAAAAPVLNRPPDLVGGSPARLVIDARLHLRDDPEQQKEDARETDHSGEQGQRRLDQRDVPGRIAAIKAAVWP